MARSIKTLHRAALGGLAAALVAALSAPATASPPVIEPEASERLRAALDFVGAQDRFALDTHATIEVVLVSGQKLQFDHATELAVQRPNKLYAVRTGELVSQEFMYDGNSLTLHELGAGVYATVEAPDTLEAMLDFAETSLDVVAPAGEVIHANAFELMMDGVVSGFLVGQAAIEGVACDHLAFSKPGTDFQIWVEQGERPLPRKLVITTRDVVSAPQFSVTIRDWDLDPDFDADLFRFDPPEGAMSIEFSTLGQAE